MTAPGTTLAQAMLRPMSAGDLLDQAVWIYRKHFRLFLVMAALLRVPIVFLTDLVQRRDADVPLAFTVGNVLGLAVDHFLVSNLLTAAIALTIGDQLADRPVSMARNYLLGARRFIPLLINDVTAMIGYAILLGVGLGCYTVMSGALFTLPGWLSLNVPGLESIIGLVTFGFSLVIGLIAALPLLGLAARWSVTAQVIVLEGRGPLAAFHRSSLLMHGQYRRVMLFLAGLFLLGITLSTAPSFVSQLLGEAVSPSYAPDSSMRVPYLVLEFGVPALIDLVFVPVTFIARTVLYYELRVRNEGYDLEKRLGEMRGNKGKYGKLEGIREIREVRMGWLRAGWLRAGWWICAVMVCAVAWHARAPLALAGEPISLDDYRRAVTEATTLVDRAAPLAPGTQRQALLQQAAALLDTPTVVQLPSGERMPVNNQVLVGKLRDASLSTTGLQAVRQRLHALQDALPRQAGQINSADQQALLDILSQPPFAANEADDWLARLIEELLRRLFGGTAQTTYDSRYILVTLGIILIAAVIAYFVINLRRNIVDEAALPSTTRDDERKLTSGAALANAQRLAVAGDYRSAVRQLYLSTLLLLNERGLLRYDRSLTNREYLRAVGNTPALRDALKPIVDTFDRIWYGFAPITADEFEQYEAQVETLRKL